MNYHFVFDATSQETATTCQLKGYFALQCEMESQLEIPHGNSQEHVLLLKIFTFIVLVSLRKDESES